MSFAYDLYRLIPAPETAQVFPNTSLRGMPGMGIFAAMNKGSLDAKRDGGSNDKPVELHVTLWTELVRAVPVGWRLGETDRWFPGFRSPASRLWTTALVFIHRGSKPTTSPKAIESVSLSLEVERSWMGSQQGLRVSQFEKSLECVWAKGQL
jgi:hypothetical protein